MTNTENKLNQKEETSYLGSEEKSLYLINDDVNTFDYVVETLVAVCDHDPHQAEQCALVAHYKGKCEIKRGNLQQLEDIQRKLDERGIMSLIVYTMID